MGKFEKGKRPTQAQSYAEPQRAPKKKKQKKQSRLGLIVALLAAAVVLQMKYPITTIQCLFQ